MKNNVFRHVGNNINRNLRQGSNNNMLRVPIFQSIGNTNQNNFESNKKLTFDDLLKFINDNKKYILDPDDRSPDVEYKSMDKYSLIIDTMQNISGAGTKIKKLQPFQTDILKNHATIQNIFDVEKISVTRVGIMNDMNGKNISFLSSVFFLVIENFSQLYLEEQYSYINNFISLAESKLNDYIKLQKLKWNKADALYSIKSFDFNKFIVKYVSDVLHVNIFIVTNENIILNNTEYTKYKKNLFLIKIDDCYEPILFNGHKYLRYDAIINSGVIHPLLLMYSPGLEKTCPLVETIDNLDIYFKNVKLDYGDKVLLSRINRGISKEFVEPDTSLREQLPENHGNSSISNAININDKFEEIIDSECDNESDVLIQTETETEIKTGTKKKYIYNREDLEKMKVTQLKEIAINNNVNHLYNVNGKQKPKKKSELIDDLCILEVK